MRKLVTSAHGYFVYEQPPTISELNTYYADKYYQSPHGTYQADYSPEEVRQRELRINLLNDFIADNLVTSTKGPFKILDVGCGEGFVLEYFLNIGWEIRGLDFSTHGVRKYNPRLEQFVTQGDIYDSLTELIKTKSTYDCIYLGNVLEHVVDPSYLMDLLVKLLREGNLLCITVPNDFSKLQRFLLQEDLVNREYWLVYPDHLNYFNLESLKSFVKSKGLNVKDQYSDFPIEWFLFNQNSNYVQDLSKGKGAHKARVLIDSMINSSLDKGAKMEFWRNMCLLGFGRTITLVLKKDS